MDHCLALHKLIVVLIYTVTYRLFSVIIIELHPFYLYIGLSKWWVYLAKKVGH